MSYRVVEKREQGVEMQGGVTEEMAAGSRVTFGGAQTIPWSCRCHVASPGTGKDSVWELRCRLWIQHLEGMQGSPELG